MTEKKTWIRHSHFLREDEYECPVCGYISSEPYNKCPSCGIRMNGSKDDYNWIDEIEELDMIDD